MKRFFAVAGGAVALLFAVLCINASWMPSRQIAPGPPDTAAIDAPAVAARLAEAVRIRTISRGDGAAADVAAIEAFHAFLATAYPKVHAALSHERVRNGIVFSWNADAPGKPILLASHIDVVPVEEGTESMWTHPPFAGEIADGFVWGRGTLDDKMGVIAILDAVESLLAQGYVPSRPVWLAFGALFTLNLVAAIPPTPTVGALLPIDGPLGIAGSLGMTGLTVALLVWVIVRRNAPNDGA